MTIDWSALNDKLPVEKTDEQKAQRQSMFNAYFDHNGTGYVSLAECEKGVRDGISNGNDETMDSIFPNPVLMRAFMAANGVAQECGGNNSRPDRRDGVDYIEFPEFRIFLLSLKQHADLWHIFDDMDSGSSSSAGNTHDSQDRRISLDEFQRALPKLTALGLQIDESDFGRIDTNGAGYILFAEFAEWGMKQQALTGSDTD